jgi:hypothetical protein
MVHNFQTGNSKIKLLTEYENITQKIIFFCNALLAALMSGRKYDVTPQSGDSAYLLWLFETKSIN